MTNLKQKKIELEKLINQNMNNLTDDNILKASQELDKLILLEQMKINKNRD
ncbi:MAG: Spo0E family sporulation regulatory protein-aspartic acid phosphatase [Clostridia bacterium]|nr:Spo0E family sporulation regulatory protein-aspartic acid phosphatase [Clostridia bacterium]